MSHPYLFPAMEHFLNSMTFRVSVPVLSLKINFTCPNSSFKFEVRAIAGVLLSAWYISISCKNCVLRYILVYMCGKVGYGAD